MLALALAPAASASPLMTLRDDGSAVLHEDPYLPAASAFTRRDRSAATTPASRAIRAQTAAERPTEITVRGELARMLAAAAIDQPTYDAHLATYLDARRFQRRLSGAPIRSASRFTMARPRPSPLRWCGATRSVFGTW